jgi:cytosine permease
MSSDQHGSGPGLGEEYEHTAVPHHARRSTFSVSTVWIGAPMIITTAITGSILVAQMGFVRALWAIVAGNILMFAYTGALAVHASRTGFNSALQASTVFGRKGYVAVSGLLSTLVLGWFAVQTGLAGTLISSAFGLDYLAMTALAGFLFLAITFMGIRGLHWIGVVSVPLFVVLGGWVLFDSAATAGWDKVVAYAGTTPDAPLAFGAGVTIVFALFADGATLTGDYSRWAPSVRGALISTASAFPFAMSIAMLVGGVMTAALQVAAPNAFGHDNMFGYMLDQHSPLLAAIALVFLVCNLGSICSHCLYFSAVGFSRMTRSTMRLCSVVLGIVGTCIAAANVWALFIPWLSLLGIIVPPIGAVMIMDLLVLRERASGDADWRAAPFAAWLVGSLVAFWVERQAPGLSTAVAAFVAAAVAYLGIAAAGRIAGVTATVGR